MTDIEKAIALLEALKWETVGKDYLLETAIEALREKAERNKECVWCRGDNKVTHDGQHFCFFCSYCGKRLEVEP